MRIRCWGSRGSLPVSGSQYDSYGGDTTCVEVRSDSGDVIIIDAGSGVRALGNQLEKEGVDQISLLFTHAHWDHIMGFPFFAPLYRRGVKVAISGCPYTFESYNHILDGLMSPPYCPVRIEMLRAKLRFKSIGDRAFSVGSVKIRPIFLNHPNGGLGFRMEENGRSFVFLTDNNLGFHHDGGLALEDYRTLCQGADLLMHDAEFTAEEYAQFKHFGHSSFQDAVQLSMAAGVKSLGLFHHNKERTDSQVDAMVTKARALIGASPLQCFAVGTGYEVQL